VASSWRWRATCSSRRPRRSSATRTASGVSSRRGE
jgi:hypothetical protein